VNLIDGHVTKVLNKREVEAATEWRLIEGDKLFGKKYTVYEVEYWDDGGTDTKELWFEKGKEPNVKEGYVFQH